jgi:hypothetical protein
MGLLANFSQHSIKSADDMVRALQLVLVDLFNEVGHCEGRGGNTLVFVVDGEHDLYFGISVIDADQPREVDKGKTPDFTITLPSAN